MLVLRGDRLPTAQRRRARGRLRRPSRRIADLLDHVVQVASRHPGDARHRRADPAHDRARSRTWADQCTLRRPVSRRRRAIPAGAAAAHPRRDRRHRRGSDDVAAGGLRRRTQLGLSILLAARCLAHPGCADRGGLRRGGKLWRDWLLRAIAGDPQDLQIMYAVDGGRDLPERTLDHLPGYAGSRPVRIGNAAVDQRQSDVLGEVMMALELARRGAWAVGSGLESAAHARQRTRRALAGAGQRPLGDQGRAAALHALAADGLGCVRSGCARRRDPRSRRAGGAVAGDPRRGA